jgi:glucokinase
MILGIDVGGSSTKMGLVVDGDVIARARIDTKGHADEHAFADAIAKEASGLCAGKGTISAVGVGAPNGNQNTGSIIQAANLPWKHEVPLAKMLSERLGVPCTLGNDANAAALGEWRFGAGKGCTDLLLATLGTGLGSGFIVDSRLLIGPFGNAGELGHITLIMDGRECGCGRKGCLESYVGIKGIRLTYQEQFALANGADVHPGILDEEGALPVALAAKDGDPIALKTFDITARMLAVGLANAVAITTPQRIVLFGGISRSGDVLMDPLKKYFEESLLPVYRGSIHLCFSELTKDDAGILGAAALMTL